MSEATFRTKRRQKFLTEKYFKLNIADLKSSLANFEVARTDELARQSFVDPSTQESSFKWALKLLRLNYTAGEPIEVLRPLYAEAMKWFREWHIAYGALIQDIGRESGDEMRTDGTPIHFDDLSHFQLIADLVSLGVLLGDASAVREVAAWVERYRHQDMLFEYLIEPAISDPDHDVGEYFHVQPYDPLLDAVFTAETPAEAQAFMQQYLDGWYKSFEGLPWHDGHLVVTDEYSVYEGYWAFEAAAVAVLAGIDDTPFRDHLVYPKELADWARAHDVVEGLKPSANAQAVRVRCEGGQSCPQAGFWSTPAQTNSRRKFSSGELMPVIKGSTWGATIWYWDEALPEL